MSTQYGFTYNADRCIKCFACEISCQQWHGIPAGTIKLRRVTEEVQGVFPNVKRKFHSVSCRHCIDAPCIKSCPENAIAQTKKGGISIITVDSNKCTGCQMCLEGCPFGIPQFNAAGIMQICDMCLDRLAEDKQPICSDACPTQALHWGLLAEIQS